jgi:hypothetical protein
LSLLLTAEEQITFRSASCTSKETDLKWDTAS